MNNLLKTIALAICISTCFSCSVEPIDSSNPELNISEEFQETADVNVCTSNDPEVRITNNGTVAINLHVINGTDATVASVTNLLPGEVSSWLSFETGEMLFSVTNDVVQDIKVTYTMDTCMIFDMEVDSNNELTSTVPQQL